MDKKKVSGNEGVNGNQAVHGLVSRQFLVRVIENEQEAWGAKVPDMFGVVVDEVRLAEDRPEPIITGCKLMLNAVSQRIGEINLGNAGEESERFPLFVVGHDPTWQGNLVPHERLDHHYLSSEESLATILSEVAKMIAAGLHPEAKFDPVETEAGS